MNRNKFVKGLSLFLVLATMLCMLTVVSLADAYDALTSKRVYKDAYPHKKAIQMIMNKECGVFNPLLLECLLDVESRIQVAMNTFPLPGKFY